MKFYQKVLASGIMLGSLIGCNPNATKEIPLEEKISGTPLSVSSSTGHGGHSLSIIINPYDEKFGTNNLLCNTNIGYKVNFTDANALIQSEINDGDNDPIELEGYLNNKIFKIKKVHLNGYTISFQYDPIPTQPSQ